MSDGFSYADYLDELRVRVGFVPFPDQPADEVWTFSVSEPASTELDPILDGVIEDLRGNDGYAPSFMAEVRRNVGSWGASGASATVVVQVASGFLVGVVVEVVRERIRDRLNQTMERAGRELGERWHPYVAPPPVELNEAQTRASWQVIEAYGLPPDQQLQLIEDEHGDGGWRIVLRDPGNADYEVWLVETSGLVAVTRVRRRQHDAD